MCVTTTTVVSKLAGYIPRWYTRPKTVTHPSTNPARRRLTSFMRRTPLTTTPRRQPVIFILSLSTHICNAVHSTVKTCRLSSVLLLSSAESFLERRVLSPPWHVTSTPLGSSADSRACLAWRQLPQPIHVYVNSQLAHLY